ncbi:MMPL family transporter [Algoriphagus sp. AGSA1]|uniref:efflux RND transporter permease subunit n=1 Tax=Algoriphagus sp. AGSA1 TaxID=2907213 RepID=UPI001F2F3F01|nr:MMPL family transporter [Algoriphagus sp. AGSA1]MCE7055316.1 MMPL family transporter [Algoriphagus sp. AGSA1]
MFQKQTAYIFLLLTVVLSIMLIIYRPVPQFDYDFETFFPQDDEDLDFYLSYRNQFENDNDYLLVALSNPEGELITPDFIKKASEVQSALQKLSQIDTLISILNLEQPIIGIFGVNYKKVLDWSDEKSLGEFDIQAEQFSSRLISKDGNSLLLWIKNSQNISKAEGDLLYDSIRSVFARYEIKPKAIAGKIQMQGDFVHLMQKEFGMFFGFSILIMLFLLVVIFRSWWAVLIPLLVLVIGVAWAFGLLVILGKPFDLMSVMQPTIFLIVGLSALIHFFTHLIKKLKSGITKDIAIHEVFKELVVAVWLTMLTTSLGFLSLYFTSIPALQDFGWTTGLGILVVFVAVICTAPGLLFLIPIRITPSPHKSEKPGVLHRLFVWQISHKKLIVFSFIGVSAVCGFVGSRIQINGYLLDNLPVDHPILQDFAYFDQNYGGSNPLEISLAVGEEASSLLDYDVLLELEKVERKIISLFGNVQPVSPLTLVKSLNQAQNQGDPDAFLLPSRWQRQRMDRWLEAALIRADIKVLSEDRTSGRFSGRTADLGSMQMTQLRRQLDDYVEEHVNPRLLQVKWTGTAYLIDKGHRSVTLQMGKGLGVAFLLVGVIVGTLFRSWRISFILLVPNLVPLLWMLGLMYFMGIELKLTTAILFTVAFGIAVDDSIHFMSRLKVELSSGKNLIYALKRTYLETGKAIVLTTIVLISGFGLLTFSQFGVTHFTGLLISASLLFALLADLMLLPLLLLPLKRMWGKSQ